MIDVEGRSGIGAGDAGRALRLLLPMALLLLVAACATPFRADVTRFQTLPAPSGQTIAIEPIDGELPGSLEFRTYAAVLQQQLATAGFTVVPDRGSAALVARFGFGLGAPRERIETTPGWGGGWGWGGWGGGWYGRGAWGWPGYGWGWGGPGWWGAPSVSSTTIFPSFVDLTIFRTADGVSLFEGRAQATTEEDSLPVLVPQLVEALFVGFPGNSGQTVRVKLPARQN